MNPTTRNEPDRPDQPWWAHRDREDHRPPAARGRGSRRGFGHTWWGRAWIRALEERAELDWNRLPRGRGYARRGTVRELSISPGLVTAVVQGTRLAPYDVTIRVRQFGPPEWDSVLEVIASQLGRTAALLDGELPPELVDDAAKAGLDFLPGAGQLQPRCSCPDFADPCKHSTAVCYLVAEALDADPFDLLLLRGRSREAVLAELRSRRTTGAGAPSSAAVPVDEIDRLIDTGVLAREAYATAGTQPETPPLPAPPSRPGRPLSLDLAPPPEAGIDVEALTRLASDAATRAWRLTTGRSDGELDLPYDVDLARRAADLVGTPELTDLAHRVGMPARELTGWAIAWREGGAGGLEVCRESWPAEPAVMQDAVAALEAAELGSATYDEQPAPSWRIWRNRLTRGRLQLRYGTDRLWYPFVKSFGGWDLAGPPTADPVGAYAEK